MKCKRFGCGREIPDDALFCPYCGKRQDTAPPVQRKKRRRPKGSGSVYRLSGNRNKPWVAMGAGKQMIGLFTTSGEAVVALDEWNLKHTPTATLKMTFAEAFEQWSKIHFQTIGNSAAKSYELSYRYCEPLYNRHMADLKTADYQSIISRLEAEGKSYSTCTKAKVLMSKLCDYAVQQDVVAKNYADFVVISVQAQKKTRVLSDEEIQRIVSKCSDPEFEHTAKLTVCLIYTGMRVNELLSVKQADVDLVSGTITGGEKTEAGKNRTIPVHPFILPIIKEQMATKAEWLFPSTRGTKIGPGNFRARFGCLMKACGIEGVSPHTCRHTAASRMVQAGVEPAAVKEILGHAQFSTTMDIYTHVDKDYLASELSKIK